MSETTEQRVIIGTKSGDTFYGKWMDSQDIIVMDVLACYEDEMDEMDVTVLDTYDGQVMIRTEQIESVLVRERPAPKPLKWWQGWWTPA